MSGPPNLSPAKAIFSTGAPNSCSTAPPNPPSRSSARAMAASPNRCACCSASASPALPKVTVSGRPAILARLRIWLLPTRVPIFFWARSRRPSPPLRQVLPRGWNALPGSIQRMLRLTTTTPWPSGSSRKTTATPASWPKWAPCCTRPSNSLPVSPPHICSSASCRPNRKSTRRRLLHFGRRLRLIPACPMPITAWRRPACEPATSRKLAPKCSSTINSPSKTRSKPSASAAICSSLSTLCAANPPPLTKIIIRKALIPSYCHPERSEGPAFRLNIETGLMSPRWWRPPAHQPYEHSIKPGRSQIRLHLHRFARNLWLVSIRPGQRISIPCPIFDIHPHVARLMPGNQSGVQPGRRCQFVPHVVGAQALLVVAGQVVCPRRSARLDLLHHVRREPGLDGNVGGCPDHLFPGRSQDNLRRLRIEPEIKFVARIVGKFRIGGLRVQASAHEHQLFCQLGKLRIECDGQRQVGHRPAGIDGYVVRIAPHHADKKMRRINLRSLGGWSALRQLGNHKRLVPPALIPCPRVRHLAVALLPQLGVTPPAHQREHCARHHRNVGAANDLQQVEHVGDLFVAPLVAAYYRYA